MASPFAFIENFMEIKSDGRYRKWKKHFGIQQRGTD